MFSVPKGNESISQVTGALAMMDRSQQVTADAHKPIQYAHDKTSAYQRYRQTETVLSPGDTIAKWRKNEERQIN